MARNKETAAPSIGNAEIIAEINLIEQIQMIESRLAYDPHSARFAQLADAYLGIGNFDTAISLCEKGLEYHPHYDTASLVMAKAYYLSGNRPRAKQVLNDFVQTHPSSLPAHKLLGDIALDEDDIVGTVNHYRVALRFDPINRQIIQTLVDLKDQYQKIKESKSGEEEDEEATPVLKAKQPATTVAPKIKDRPKTPSVADDSGDSKVTDELLMREEEEFKSSLELKPPEKPATETAITPTAESAPVVESKSVPKAVPETSADSALPHGAAMKDASGLLYFYDDDEVSFAEYKLRQQMQKEGKAILMDRAELDARIAKLAKPPVPKKEETAAPAVKVKAPVKLATDDVYTSAESAFGGKEETPTIALHKPAAEIEGFERADAEVIEESPLSVEEQEAALEDVELSYKDYLDILTDEDELLEAIFTEERGEEREAKQESSLAERLAGLSGSDEEQRISYLDYLQDLSDEELAEASFDDAPLSLDAFSEYLDRSDETIDFATFEFLVSRNGEALTLFEEAEMVDEGPEIAYGHYVDSLTDAERSELGLQVVATAVEVAAPASLPAEQQPVAEPVVQETMPAPVEIEEIVEAEPVKEIAAMAESVAVEPVAPAVTETPKPVLAAAEAVEETEEEEAVEEDYTEEEINPQDASPELVEKFASRGMFGSAYKVCKMLKVKNPTDAKIDRKILELKRLYLWSSQIVG